MQIGREKTVEILKYLGYQVSKNYSFNLDPLALKHSFATILENGEIVDKLGVKESIENILVKYFNHSLQESRKKINLWLNQPKLPLLKFQNFKKQCSKAKKQELQAKHKFFRKSVLQNPSIFEQYLSQFLCSTTRSKYLELAYRYEIGYSKKTDRLTLPFLNFSGEIVNFFKYSPHQHPIFEKGISREAFPLQDLKIFNKDCPILICEGEKDTLNAIAHGYQAITSGGATTLFSKKVALAMSGFEVWVCGDYQDAGERYKINIAHQLEPFARRVRIIDMQKLYNRYQRVFNDLQMELKKGFDLTDFLMAKKECKELVIEP